MDAVAMPQLHSIADHSSILNQGPRVSWYGQGDRHREKVERYIADIFRTAHGATITEYLPLLCMLERDMDPVAALGLRSATRDTLFCERYLDEPIEVATAREFGQRVPRSEIMELGNLASSASGDAVFLYLLATAAMGFGGVRYLTFAANRSVRLSIQRCGFDTRVICDADPACLGADRELWGSYYEGDPKVVFADLHQAMQFGHLNEKISRHWHDQALTVNTLADQIRETRE
jgi:hypothetical protein